LDVSKLRALGWKPSIPLRDGIARTYEWFLANCARWSVSKGRFLRFIWPIGPKRGLTRIAFRV